MFGDVSDALAPEVLAKLETLPAKPGVYVFRDAERAVLYIGKARSLRSRVRSYFQPGTSDVRAFVARLEHELADIETFVATSEKEAALLENQLIKEHQPRYNVKLRDDKEFLSLRLQPKGFWPRLEAVRRPKPDGALYFGPYHSATAARQTLKLVNRHFQLRTCTDAELRRRTRPCLQYQIKRCPGPCVVPVDREEYAASVDSVGLFLDGRHDELIESLTGRMRAAAEDLAYEEAALYRDQLRAVERVREKQRVATVKDVDQDVVGLFRQAEQVELAVLIVREGKIVSVRTYDIKDVQLPDDELLAAFLREWYERAPVPDEVLLPFEVEAMDGLAGALADVRAKRGRSKTPKLLVPQRGAKTKLVQMAQENAAHAFKEKRRAEEDVESRLAVVQEKLRLPRLPRRIECVDVSHTGGDEAVAAVVSLADGAPERSRYRSFKVKRATGGDDYGSMREVLLRRFRRGREGQLGWELPDLFVVDGGKGQLNVARAVLRDLGMELPVVGLAKEKETPLGEKLVDRVYLPGQKNPVPLRAAPALQMLALARDEAHRASNAHRKKLRTKRQLRSELDGIKGVGPKTRSRLLEKLGSMRGVREATLDELVAAGATRRQAVAIQRAFGDAAPEARGVDDAEDAAVDNAFAELEP